MSLLESSATFLAEEIFILHSIFKNSFVQTCEKTSTIHSHVAQLEYLEDPLPAAADDNSHHVTISTRPKSQTQICWDVAFPEERLLLQTFLQ